MAKAPEKLTLETLAAREDIPAATRQRIVDIAIRLIQIQDETDRLETERGYSQGGKRFPGLADELEGFYVRYDLPGMRIENYIVVPTHGSNTRIDRDLLLAEGVSDLTIKACTVGSNWTGVAVKKDREPSGEPSGA